MTETIKSEDCLIELGMEELPPKAIHALISAFAENIANLLKKHRLEFDQVTPYSAPRRLALVINGLQISQADERQVLRGPPVKVAFDDKGNPTRAALAFAKKAGVEVSDLGREATEKGEWLSADSFLEGKQASDLLPAIIQQSLETLPIPRRMRWGANDASFVRPVHWLVVLHGADVVPMRLFGIESGQISQGHRFHNPGPVSLSHPNQYIAALHDRQVIVDVELRRRVLWESALAAAKALRCQIKRDEALIEETAALCDWPVAVAGEFDARFLELPEEVLVSTLKVHQRFFPTYDANGNLKRYFITIANIDSKDPDAVRRGNQRVVTPRLSDAEFFWQNDQKQALADRKSGLDRVIYQKALGSIAEKMKRVAHLAEQVSSVLKVDHAHVTRTTELMRVDLLTDMVGEFPELQGTMGAYYAEKSGEAADVVTAIREQYLPAFAGDNIPTSTAGKIVGVADRLDTLAGIFAIGKRPSGNRDPFGLRRAALGLLRIIIEGELELDLPDLIHSAVQAQPIDTTKHPELADDLYDFVIDRLRSYFQSSICVDRPDLFESVLAREPRSMLDFKQRLQAVAVFSKLDAAHALASVNKRIANILRNGGVDANASLDRSAIKLDAEQLLLDALDKAQEEVEPLIAERNYTIALGALSKLEQPVGNFFEDVMVMDEDVAVRRNRMALLSEVRGLFLRIADISELTFPAS